MLDFSNSKYVKEICDITLNMYNQGWDERNGGNISLLIDESEVLKYFKVDSYKRSFYIGFTVSDNIKGKYFLVTGTGKYFKNIHNDPENNLGLVRISEDGLKAFVYWGFDDGSLPTSEFPAHLLSHSSRLSANPKNRVIIHTHPTYTICMGACVEVSDIEFTRKLWKTNTEAVVVFPEGIGVLPCMVCGTTEIGEATAKLMETKRIVSWTNHGIYGAGETIDEAFGLIETVEKTAKIYMLTLGHVVNEIPDEVILGLAKLWNLKIMPGVIKEK